MQEKNLYRVSIFFETVSFKLTRIVCVVSSHVATVGYARFYFIVYYNSGMFSVLRYTKIWL